MHKIFGFISLLAAAVFLSACHETVKPNSVATRNVIPDRAARIVSLDFCADQYVLKLAEREDILALSPDSTKEFSYLKEVAIGLPTTRASAEDILALAPDIVVRSYGGGPHIESFLSRAGITVINIPWADDFGSIADATHHVAKGLGQEQRGQELVADMNARLDAIAKTSKSRRLLYMTQGGATTGEGSLVNLMIERAGYENFETRKGWHDLPLERLAYEQPDIVAGAFFTHDRIAKNGWSSMRHDVASRTINENPAIKLESAWLSCGAWFALDAVEALSEGAK